LCSVFGMRKELSRWGDKCEIKIVGDAEVTQEK
jgi:hypothetical protein